MDVIAAYRDVGTYRGAAEICGITHKTVKRTTEAHELVSEGGSPPERVPRAKNYDRGAELIAASVKKTAGKISAKRLLPAARAAGYQGSDRNFRRLVAQARVSGVGVRSALVAGVRRSGHRQRGAGHRLGRGGHRRPEGARVLRGAGVVAVPVRPLRR